ncbi:MAG: class I SAM-dependent methyltransferase [Chloroflexi bacterium]|nr:class I SAM-dependent methyltransferase [Chloroflexota bacterium]
MDVSSHTIATSSEATERQRRVWDKRAPTFDRSMGLMEKLLFGDGRLWISSRASGEVLEVAVGTGRNFRFYPDGVRLTGIELSAEMLAIARRQAADLGIPAELHLVLVQGDSEGISFASFPKLSRGHALGDAQVLAFPDAAFDTVVCTFSLCGIPDDRRAVAEMKRVLRPGGRLLLIDHVPSSTWLWRGIQWLLEQVTVRVEGEYLLRRPLELVRAEGFEIEHAEWLKAGIVERISARKVR